MNRTRRTIWSGGYALLMTLLLLAMAGALLAMTARTGARRAIEAVDQAQAVQRKWAMRTVEACVLPNVEKLLDQARLDTDPPGPPLASIRRTLRLNGMAIDLTLACEEAKLNVNELLARRGARAAGDTLRGMFETLDLDADVRFPPLDEDAEPPIAAWDQFLSDLHPDALAEGPARYLTCWTQGAVDFRLAPPPVLVAALRPDLSQEQIQTLLEARQDNPEPSLSDTIGRLELNDRQHTRLKGRLTEEPATYSIWTTIHDSRRSWHAFIVKLKKDEKISVVRLRW